MPDERVPAHLHSGDAAKPKFTPWLAASSFKRVPLRTKFAGVSTVRLMLSVAVSDVSTASRTTTSMINSPAAGGTKRSTCLSSKRGCGSRLAPAGALSSSTLGKVPLRSTPSISITTVRLIRIDGHRRERGDPDVGLQRLPYQRAGAVEVVNEAAALRYFLRKHTGQFTFRITRNKTDLEGFSSNDSLTFSSHYPSRHGQKVERSAVIQGDEQAITLHRIRRRRAEQLKVVGSCRCLRPELVIIARDLGCNEVGEHER